MSARIAVYRMFGAREALLYVGKADSFGRRWQQHASAQSWWPEVERMTVEWYPDLAAALRVEAQAIEAERPRYNKIAGHLSPGRGITKHRMVRFSDEDWALFGALAAQMGTDRSAVLRQLAQWWMRRGVRLPDRPPAK